MERFAPRIISSQTVCASRTPGTASGVSSGTLWTSSKTGAAWERRQKVRAKNRVFIARTKSNSHARPRTSETADATRRAHEYFLQARCQDYRVNASIPITGSGVEVEKQREHLHVPRRHDHVPVDARHLEMRPREPLHPHAV